MFVFRSHWKKPTYPFDWQPPTLMKHFLSSWWGMPPQMYQLKCVGVTLQWREIFLLFTCHKHFDSSMELSTWKQCHQLFFFSSLPPAEIGWCLLSKDREHYFKGTPWRMQYRLILPCQKTVAIRKVICGMCIDLYLLHRFMIQ